MNFSRLILDFISFRKSSFHIATLIESPSTFDIEIELTFQIPKLNETRISLEPMSLVRYHLTRNHKEKQKEKVDMQPYFKVKSK